LLLQAFMSSHVSVLSAILAGYLAFAGAARAEPAPDASRAQTAPLTERRERARRWYGWQTLTFDAAALGVGVTGVSLHEAHPGAGVVLGATGLLGYSLSGPVVHWAHARPGAAGASLALRLGLPLLTVGVLSGGAAARCPGTGGPDDERYCERMERTLLVAGSLSLLAASLLDASFLGWESPPRTAKSAALTPLVPVLAWDGRRGATLGLGGAF
jgi:hypothetical protein